MSYRPDIEGLRAIAILLVVMAHARVPWMAGGFIGVDVFFVLSGYLITSLLRAEIEASGRVDFIAFYARRFRRLAPSLCLVLVTTLVAAFFVLSPAETHPQSKAAGAAALWGANLHFIFAGQGYFDPSAESNLFLHLWSLGVEEQFYLVWPVLVALAASRMRGVMIAVAVGSFALSLRLSHEAPTFAFYMMPTRAWQFAVGALMVGTTLPKGYGWAGLSTVVGSALLIQPDDVFPGLWALLPTLGTAAILAAGGVSVLTHPRVQALGTVSYSLYLWHWPILLLGDRVAADVPEGPRRLLMVLISLALAAATYWLIERPIRRVRIDRPGRLVAVVSAVLALFSVGMFTWAYQTDDSYRQSLAKQLPEIYQRGCDSYTTDDIVKPCEAGDPSAQRTAVLIGDSIGMQWYPAVSEAFTREGWRLVALTKSACPMVDEPVYHHGSRDRFLLCESWRDKALDVVVAMKPDLVVFGSSHVYAFDDAQWREGSSRVMTRLRDASAHVVLIESTPRLAIDVFACLQSGGACGSPPDSAALSRVFELQRAVAGPLGVRSMSMNDLICPRGRCEAMQGGEIVYRDRQHLTAAYVKTLAGEFGTRVRR